MYNIDFSMIADPVERDRLMFLCVGHMHTGHRLCGSARLLCLYLFTRLEKDENGYIEPYTSDWVFFNINEDKFIEECGVYIPSTVLKSNEAFLVQNGFVEKRDNYWYCLKTPYKSLISVIDDHYRIFCDRSKENAVPSTYIYKNFGCVISVYNALEVVEWETR